MKIWILKGAVILCCIKFAVGCATIIHGTGQNIQVNSDPDEAEIWIDGANYGNTPSRVFLSRKNDYYLVIKKEGFEDSATKIKRETSGWLLGNIVFGGLIGCGIDFSSGGAYDLHPDKFLVNLTRKEITSDTDFPAAKEKKVYQMPLFLNLELEHNIPKVLFNGKVSLTYKDFAWRESVIMGADIVGFAKKTTDEYSKTSIYFSKGDLFYMKINSGNTYQVEVIQEQYKKVYLELRKMTN
jgi:hypothetical protein